MQRIVGMVLKKIKCLYDQIESSFQSDSIGVVIKLDIVIFYNNKLILNLNITDNFIEVI